MGVDSRKTASTVTVNKLFVTDTAAKWNSPKRSVKWSKDMDQFRMPKALVPTRGESKPVPTKTTRVASFHKRQKSRPTKQENRRWYFTESPTPVRVYVSYQKEPQIKYVAGILDTAGRPLWPLSRQHLLQGMVYDRTCRSFYPPPPVGQTVGMSSDDGVPYSKRKMSKERRLPVFQAI